MGVKSEMPGFMRIKKNENIQLPKARGPSTERAALCAHVKDSRHNLKTENLAKRRSMNWLTEVCSTPTSP